MRLVDWTKDIWRVSDVHTLQKAQASDLRTESYEREKNSWEARTVLSNIF